MTHLVSIDFETRSPIDLRVAGVDRYVEHPETGVWCMAYCLSDDPTQVRVWEREDEQMPHDLWQALSGGAYLRAWNAAFERKVWNRIMVERYGWVPLPTERFICVMALAAAAALPLQLEKAALALRVTEQKDMEGSKLMKKMSKPRGLLGGAFTWWDEPEYRQRLSSYCAQDVRTEMALWRKLPPAMDARERAIWLLDQKINDRGIALDLPLIVAARDLVNVVQPKLTAELLDLTGGLKVTQVAKLKTWLAERGVEADSLNKATVSTLLTEVGDPEIRRVLEARRDGAKSSTSKYASMLNAVCADGRVRGTMQYYGATTGRWAGRGIQPHNNPTPQRKITRAILDDIRTGSLEWIELLHGPVLPLLADTLRSCFIASPGKKLAVADYSTIEARVIAWLAGEELLLEQFRQKAKLYEEFGAAVHEVDVSVLLDYKRDTGSHHPWRQEGKTGILGGGFGMGAKRCAEQYGIPIELAAKIIRLYRSTYPAIPDLWSSMNDAANMAVLQKTEVGVEGTDGRLRFEAKGGYLLLHLPSGRPLWYHAPHVETYKVVREEIEVDPFTGQEVVIDRSFYATGVTISTLHGTTKQWVRQRMYGGLWAENATQAVARDLMADAMLRCEARGVPVILSVHDEVVAEVEPTMRVSAFVDILEEVPVWATGCPIAAEGYIEERYRK